MSEYICGVMYTVVIKWAQNVYLSHLKENFAVKAVFVLFSFFLRGKGYLRKKPLNWESRVEILSQHCYKKGLDFSTYSTSRTQPLWA